MRNTFDSALEVEATGVAPASLSSQQLQADLQRPRDRYNRVMRAAAAMRKHVAFRNGKLQFALPAQSTREAASKLGIDHTAFAHLHDSMKNRNLLAARAGTTRNPLAPPLSKQAEFESNPACKGVTKFESHWWGSKIWLDSCMAGQVGENLKIGAPVGAICGVLGAAPCTVLAGLTAANGFRIVGANNGGGNQGVILTWTWAQLVPPLFEPFLPLITSQ